MSPLLPSDLRASLARLRAAALLRGCDQIGVGASVVGRPVIKNLGRMEIGRSFAMSAVPVASHLATGRSGHLRIGDRVRIAHGASIYSDGLVEIGDDCTIGPMVMILDVDFHEIHDREAKGRARPISIGRGVHLGCGVIVLRGAVIGDGAQIEAGSVVSRRLPADMLASGVPARPLGSAWSEATRGAPAVA
jgi:acetyltransferase-like isoleucine patch superfamily enzyme